LEKEDYQAAFLLNATSSADILTVVDRGETMPQKSTYFYPKLLTGMVFNPVSDPWED
jgi:uncharacterized protein (DUF1015 family)